MIDAETTERWQDGELDFEDLSSPLPTGQLTPEHLAEYCREHYDDDRVSKLAFGVCAGEQGSSTTAELTAEGNRKKLIDEFGIDYKQLERAARSWQPELSPERAIEALDGHKGDIARRSREHWEARAESETDDGETGADGDDEFRRRVRETLSGRCGMLADEWLALLTQLADEMEEQGVDGDDLTDDITVARQGDVKAVKSERDRLVGSAGIPDDEAESLSLGTLRRLADDDGSTLDTLAPAPRSGDVQATGDAMARYDEPEKARELKQKIEHLKTHAGDSNQLARRQLEMYESELEDMR